MSGTTIIDIVTLILGPGSRTDVTTWLSYTCDAARVVTAMISGPQHHRTTGWGNSSTMLHRFPDDAGFDYRRQMGELEYVTSSRAAGESLAENYTGLPLAD